MKFVDGHGDKRVFCKSCGRSYLENFPIAKVPHDDQSNILGFSAGIYHRPGIGQFV